MRDTIMLAYELLTAILPALVTYALVTSWRKKRGLSRGAKNLFALVLLAVYVGLVFMVTGAGTLYDLMRFGFEYSLNEINLQPFIFDSYTAQYTLNVVMFLPLGVLLPMVWPGCDKLRYALAYGAGFSLLIELSQLLNRRATDIDDLLMNTLGALIGYGIYKAVQAIRKPRSTNDADAIVIPGSNENPALPVLYLGAMFAGRFFLFDGIGVATALYWS